MYAPIIMYVGVVGDGVVLGVIEVDAVLAVVCVGVVCDEVVVGVCKCYSDASIAEVLVLYGYVGAVG